MGASRGMENQTDQIQTENRLQIKKGKCYGENVKNGPKPTAPNSSTYKESIRSEIPQKINNEMWLAR